MLLSATKEMSPQVADVCGCFRCPPLLVAPPLVVVVESEFSSRGRFSFS
jgi:hypothetical protein